MTVSRSILSRLGLPRREHEKRAGLAPLSAMVAAALIAQLPDLRLEDLRAYTFETRRSSSPEARDDYAVYDAAGSLRYEGRSFDSSVVEFWERSISGEGVGVKGETPSR
jgi:hypothetical protein